MDALNCFKWLARGSAGAEGEGLRVWEPTVSSNSHLLEWCMLRVAPKRRIVQKRRIDLLFCVFEQRKPIPTDFKFGDFVGS